MPQMAIGSSFAFSPRGMLKPGSADILLRMVLIQPSSVCDMLVVRILATVSCGIKNKAEMKTAL